jgi:hypothetical protein
MPLFSSNAILNILGDLKVDHVEGHAMTGSARISIEQVDEEKNTVPFDGQSSMYIGNSIAFNVSLPFLKQVGGKCVWVGHLNGDMKAGEKTTKIHGSTFFSHVHNHGDLRGGFQQGNFVVADSAYTKSTVKDSLKALDKEAELSEVLALQSFLAHYQKAEGEDPKEPLQYISDCLFTKKQRECENEHLWGALYCSVHVSQKA